MFMASDRRFFGREMAGFGDSFGDSFGSEVGYNGYFTTAGNLHTRSLEEDATEAVEYGFFVK